MAMKVCLGCGALTNYGSRCQRCTTTRYGRAHRQTRAGYVPVVHLGIVDCARCGKPIEPTDRWHLDHTDDGTTYLGPSHVACNVNPTTRKTR